MFKNFCKYHSNTEQKYFKAAIVCYKKLFTHFYSLKIYVKSCVAATVL